MLLLALTTGGPIACASNRISWQEEMVRWYPNGIGETNQLQHIAAVDRGSDYDLFQKRIGFADTAALGSIRLVNEQAEHGAAPSKTLLIFRPVEVLHGSLAAIRDKDGDILLSADRAELPSEGLDQESITRKNYLLFLKRQPGKVIASNEKGWRGSIWGPRQAAARYRWVLYPSSPKLLEEVQQLYQLAQRGVN
jgi:hypothetical protein